jgi:hypothetical protein
MEETGGIPSEKNVNGGKGGFYLFDHFHDIVALMVPVEVQSENPRRLFSNIFDDRKSTIFNPLHSQVYDLSRNAMVLKNVGQPEEPHGEEVDPGEMIDRPVVIGQLRNMEKNAGEFSHWAEL